MVGSLVLDRFRLAEELGSGAYGTVSKAWDIRLKRDVAVKAIPVRASSEPRVMREAHAAARLSHRGIVTLYEVGVEDGVAYLVTELVEGCDLRQALDRGELSDREIADLGADLCEALDHAHSRGVVHRDIKPANVLVADAGGEAKLMDFGVARLTDEAGLTATGDVVGTLAYMSPEQAEGLAAGPPSDVYSLGIVLYEALCGENPNRRRTPVATVGAIGKHPPALCSRRADLPERLTDVIDACLDPDPELRPSLEQLGSELERSLPWLESRSPARRPSRLRLPGLFRPAAAMGGVPFRPLLWLALLAAVAASTLVFASPGAAALIVLCLLPVAVLVRGSGPLVLLPLLAPLLGLVSLAPLYPALAGLGSAWRERVVLALSGFAAVIAVQVTFGLRELGLGSLAPAPEGWSASAMTALGAVLGPLADQPRLLASAAVWVAAALVVGILTAPLRAWTGGHGFFRRMDPDLPTEPTRSRARSIRSR